MVYDVRIPGLTADHDWDLPERLNMARQVLADPDDRVAIIDLTKGARRRVTRADLAQRVDALARYLRRRVQPGDRVGVLFSQDPWCPVAHLAIWKIGAISVPLFTLFKHAALASRIGDSGLSLVLTNARNAPSVAGLAEAVLAEDVVAEEGLRDTPEVDFADTGPDDPAVLMYTSGTTGPPKGALLGHRVLTGHLPGVWASHDGLGQRDDRLWTPADWAWIGGLFDVLMPGLALGVPVVAVRMGTFSAAGCATIIAGAGVRNVFLPPTALRMLKAADRIIPGLRSVASGGEPLGPEMLTWGRVAFGLDINEFYGQTECNMTVSSCGTVFPPQPGCIGRAVPGHEVAVIDDAGNPTRGEGDVAVRRGSASMMLRYWNNPEATEAKFRGDWLVTGDRGIWEGAYLRFIGREDDVITTGGYRIGPAEVEDCLLTHPAIVTVGVVGKPDALRGQIVKAYVVCKPGEEPPISELRAWVKDRLAGHSYPREIDFVDSLPMTVTGKVIRKELKRRAASEVGEVT